jgi:hypothetical protein
MRGARTETSKKIKIPERKALIALLLVVARFSTLFSVFFLKKTGESSNSFQQTLDLICCFWLKLSDSTKKKKRKGKTKIIPKGAPIQAKTEHHAYCA